MSQPRVAVEAIAAIVLALVAPAPVLATPTPPRSVSFTNAGAITIADNVAASPYPSTVVVSGFTPRVAAVTVTLYGFTHTRPADVDIMLVGPTGQAVLLISDVGGTTSVSGVTLTLDSALGALTTGPLTSGRYRPTNLDDGGSDVFPPTAPVAGSTGLGPFEGVDPNGTWSLYVRDDQVSNSGVISGGWSLTLHSESWNAAPAMASQRLNHDATLMQDGRILVTGGGAGVEAFNSVTGKWQTIATIPGGAGATGNAILLPTGRVLVLRDTECTLFNPRDGSWTSTGSLVVPRIGPTLTLLRDGRVLAAGGSAYPGGTALLDAELYNPATGLWSLAGSMAAARLGHTATLLPNGRVLVAGGAGVSAPLASAEVFNPATQTWSSTGALALARRNHTATLLPTGLVLVAGGSDAAFQGLASSELYNPGAGTWSATGALNTRRVSHMASLLPDGRVMVTGGYYGGQGVLRSTEVYTPGTGLWTEDGVMRNVRGNATTTLLPSGEVLITGGGDGGGYQGSCEVYRSFSTAWSSTGSLPQFTTDGTTTLLPDGRVVFIGGGTASVALFNPATDSWTAGTAAPVALQDHTATLLYDGRILVTGGIVGATPVSTTRLYDPAAQTWTAGPPMSRSRAAHTATSLADGRILVTGGTENGSYFVASKSAEVFDPSTNAWTTTGSMAAGHMQHPGVLLPDGRVLVIAGFDGGVSGGTEIWNPGTGTWASAGSLTVARWEHSATALPDGRVLLVGGSDTAGFNPIATTEIFDPTSGIWTAGPSLKVARVSMAVTALRSGRILVTGGYGPTGNTATTEILEPSTGSWELAPSLSFARRDHRAIQLLDGRVLVAGGFPTGTEIMALEENPTTRGPIVTAAPSQISFGTPFAVTGTRFRGDSEGGSGRSSDSPGNYPLATIQSLESGRLFALIPDSRPNLGDEPATFDFSELPASLDVGWHRLTVLTAGIPSAARVVRLGCSVAITGQPANALATPGQPATFSVVSQGGRAFQWEKDGGFGWAPISGATARTYATPPVVGPDSGTKYRVLVQGACGSTYSSPATLTVADSTPPVAVVVAPSGGEFWLLGGEELVTWSMSDDVRICQVSVSLRYSNDGGATYLNAPAGGGLPATFGSGGSCGFPGVTTTNLPYATPVSFPSGTSGSLYKVRVVVTDQAGNPTVAESASPFYIVSPNTDTVRTLVLSNVSRMQSVMGTTALEASALASRLQELSSHPRVQGTVVDLAGVTSINSLYADWDADNGNADKANRVLLGCHSPCSPERNGIHDHVRSLLGAYTGVKYVVLAGDDRIIPYARISDHTTLFSESNYTAGSTLSPTGTTVGKALAGNQFLSDDALAMTSKVIPTDLNAGLLVPDLSIGRLVETPAEITKTIATYISQDGILDVTGSTNKVLVTGYDFLTDVGKVIRKRWKGSLGVASPDGSLAPVNGSLIGDTWGLGTVPARVSALQTQLGGHYGLINLNGHATHFEEGVPGTNPFDINGLSANSILGLDLSGSVIYGVGCHGGLSVPGSNPADLNNSLDLPQTFLSRGAVAYVANTGYGWGLKAGIGYGERLSQLFTEQVTKSGTVSIGDAVVGTKRRYVLEGVRTDPYDQKSLMQWTLYGLPMYALRTGITSASAPPAIEDPLAPGVEPRPPVEQYGGVRVERRVLQTSTAGSPPSSGVLASAPLPSYLTQLSLHFDFTAPGVYRKWTASGDEVVPATAACPDAGGCYYTLNGLVERSSGMADVPVQPYFIYDSRLSGTSQHGVLWKGGVYEEESGWVPVVAELQSNGGDGSNHGPAPRGEMIDPVSPRVVPGGESATCRPSDSELNSLVVPTGEAFMPPGPATTYSIERKYRSVDLEVFYFNNTVTPGQNCDRDGPVLSAGPYGGSYHQASGSTLQWGIPATDVGSGVWRVLVVYSLNTVIAGQGTWQPVELTDDGSGTWRGSISVGGSNLLTYVVQAVDRRGNVTWLRYVNAQLPASGVAQSMPLPVDVTVLNQAPAANAQSVTTTVGVPVPITLTGSDPNGDPLTYAVASAPLHGVLGGAAPNLTYAPLGGYAGADSFTFTVSDGALVSPPATVSVTVNAIALSVSKSGTGSGTVTSNTGGINCGATCSAEYTQNTGVTLLAAPSPGSSFAGWSGACSGSGPCQVVMDTTKSVGAAFLFTPAIAVGSLPNPSSVGQTVTLTANVSGSGPIPTGTVQFKANGVNVGSTVALASGAATTTTSFGSPGTRVITAEYSGDGSYLAGTGTLSGGQVVQPAGTSPRAYVSVSGSDSNTCSSPATPCRTFAGAIAQVTSGGEIVVKTSGTFGGGSIGKSVTINAPAGVAVLAATPIVVNAGATDVVTFRGITFVSPTPGSGTALTFTTGGGLNLERCVFHGWNTGLLFPSSGKLNVVDTVVRDNATAGISLSAGVASIERSRLTGNGTGLQVLSGAEAVVKESVVAANGAGLDNAGSMLDVEDSVVTNNSAAGVSGSAGTTRVSGSTVTNNTIGLQQSGSGVVQSRGGNTVEGNGTNTAGTISSYPAK